ncbi:MAG: sensor histidine kinase [Deltaproteobacteria bacterium]|nr:MAG: sensor histidine kinase [Deltaproteobacteria bacterium]
MRRRALFYALIVAVLVASAGLASLSLSLSRDVAERERRAILDTTRELALEKVLGVEAELAKSENAVFDAVDVSNLLDFQKKLAAERPAVETVLILSDRWEIIPDGFFTRRRSPASIEQFRERFRRDVLPHLRARPVGLDERARYHLTIDGRPYLFSVTRRVSGGRPVYVVVEVDLAYMVGTVFPQYFAVTGSPRVYQIVDEVGDIVYGYAFTGVPADQIVEVGFPDSFRQWRLRVAQREPGLAAAHGKRRVVDVALIAVAVAVIFAGIAGLVWAERSARRANALKSDFISNVSHELKTPISIIQMFGEMLYTGRTTSPEQAREYAGVIARESTRLGRLIDNVLDFSRLERGKGVYDMAEGDFAEVVERSLDIYRHRLDQAGMELRVDVDPGLPPVEIDENAMTLAVLNLVDNAIKYAADGKRLDVRVARDGDGVALAVADYGPGVARDEQKRIFERFYRSKQVRLKSSRGSGIGLALVKDIAEAHGGSVDVRSSPRDGTTFTIWIPVRHG